MDTSPPSVGLDFHSGHSSHAKLQPVVVIIELTDRWQAKNDRRTKIIADTHQTILYQLAVKP